MNHESIDELRNHIKLVQAFALSTQNESILYKKGYENSLAKLEKLSIDAHKDCKDHLRKLHGNPNYIDETIIEPLCVRVSKKHLQLYKSALCRGILFNLTHADVEHLISQTKCFYTGVLFDDDKHKATVDRIDSNIGYVGGNVVMCSDAVNKLKNVLFERTPSTISIDLDSFISLVNSLMKSGIPR